MRRFNVQERQTRMREHHFRAAFADTADASISGAWIAAMPDGRIRTTIHHVEREQVPALIGALDELRANLLAFHSAAQGSARVYALPTRPPQPLNEPPPTPVPRAA